jgi:hypothetical protein
MVILEPRMAFATAFRLLTGAGRAKIANYPAKEGENGFRRYAEWSG